MKPQRQSLHIVTLSSQALTVSQLSFDSDWDLFNDTADNIFVLTGLTFLPNFKKKKNSSLKTSKNESCWKTI